MDDKENKLLWNFRLIDILVAVAIGLLGWNLKETIALKQIAGDIQGQQDIMELRLTILESEKNKGGRFTSADGQLLLKDIQHNRDMIVNHIKRTEPKIDSMYESLRKLAIGHQENNVPGQ
jgi:hypothetical protein